MIGRDFGLFLQPGFLASGRFFSDYLWHFISKYVSSHMFLNNA